MMWKSAVLILGILLPIGIAHADRLHFLDCAEVRFFDEECAPADTAVPEEPQAPAPPSKPLLFPRETVARDAPAALLTMMEDPTESNIQAFVQWQAQRMNRIKEVLPKVKAYMQSLNGRYHDSPLP